MKNTHISFEFFPPKTPEGVTQLQLASKELSALSPEFFSVTFGAGGSTQELTFETVQDIRAKTKINTAPHISCVSSKREQIGQLLKLYQENKINKLVTLRGDLPSGMGSEVGEFRYARDLVTFIREQTGDYFHLAVAAHPEFHPQTEDAVLGLKHFHEKVAAGANSAITQYFYNPDAYFRFVDECQKRGITIPIIPGIMPITNYKQLVRFSDACGAEIPRWLRIRLEGLKDDLDAIRALGIEVVSKLCRDLVQGGAPGLHFYTLNRAHPTLEILANLD